MMPRVCRNVTCLSRCHVSVTTSRVCYDDTCFLRCHVSVTMPNVCRDVTCFPPCHVFATMSKRNDSNYCKALLKTLIKEMHCASPTCLPENSSQSFSSNLENNFRWVVMEFLTTPNQNGYIDCLKCCVINSWKVKCTLTIFNIWIWLAEYCRLAMGICTLLKEKSNDGPWLMFLVGLSKNGSE